MTLSHWKLVDHSVFTSQFAAFKVTSSVMCSYHLSVLARSYFSQSPLCMIFSRLSCHLLYSQCIHFFFTHWKSGVLFLLLFTQLIKRVAVYYLCLYLRPSSVHHTAESQIWFWNPSQATSSLHYGHYSIKCYRQTVHSILYPSKLLPPLDLTLVYIIFTLQHFRYVNTSSGYPLCIFKIPSQIIIFTFNTH